MLTMSRHGRHPKKEIAKALDAAAAAGFSVEEIHRGHRWGRVVCPGCGEACSAYSTPRVPEHNAKQIRRFVEVHIDHASQEGDR
jgi:hypothetical protein